MQQYNSECKFHKSQKEVINISAQEPYFILMCFGLIFFSVGILALKSMMPKMEDKKKTKGELVDYIESYDRKHGTMWHAVYRFDVDGRIYKTTSSIRFSGKRMIKKSSKN